MRVLLSRCVVTTANVLIVGRKSDEVARATEALKARGYAASGETEDPEALATMKNARVDIVVLGAGIDPESRNRLIETAESRCPGVKIVEQFGGFENILPEVEAARDSR